MHPARALAAAVAGWRGTCARLCPACLQNCGVRRAHCVLPRFELVAVHRDNTSSQPGSRHSAPAARKISARPSASAMRFTSCDPGTIQHARAIRDLAPVQGFCRGAQIRSRPLVQDPIKTTSTGWPNSGMPWSQAHVRQRFLQLGALGGVRDNGGSGIRPLIEARAPGLVP